MKASGPPIEISPLTKSVQFLRGVQSRSSLCVPAFHFFVGSQCYKEARSQKNYPDVISATYLDFSAMNTLTLACRNVFDHDPSGLTGAYFSKISDELLIEHAQYWASSANKLESDAVSALLLIREFFKRCSMQSNRLLEANSSLQMRIGLLKQHADRSAAHLSLENYEIHLLDLVHFTASICLVGEIIRTFDDPVVNSEYFNKLDISAHYAAKKIFPMLSTSCLFNDYDIAEQAAACWKFGGEIALQLLLNDLPNSLNWY